MQRARRRPSCRGWARRRTAQRQRRKRTCSYAHVGTGAAIGYLFTSYYSPGAAFGAGLAVALGKEIMDKRNNKSFSRTDVVTRLLGTGVGVYIAKTF
jgi:hypothetical protein